MKRLIVLIVAVLVLAVSGVALASDLQGSNYQVQPNAAAAYQTGGVQGSNYQLQPAISVQ